MNTIRFKLIAKLACFLTTVLAFAAGCGKSEIEPFDSKAKIWFTQTDDNKANVGNIIRSFSHYPGTETLDVTFEVNLIGLIADFDREYKAVVVDTLTTAVPAEYDIHPMVLHANKAKDLLTITLKKSDRLLRQDAKLTLYLVETESFEQGYTDRLQVSVTFNNITTKPDWWTEEITKAYLGEYSKEKFEAIYAYSGRNNLEGLQPSELRILLRGFKNYIREHNLTEADGTPITIPIY